MSDTLTKEDCLDFGSRIECSGAVEYRMALSGTGKPYPRCDLHWERRLVEQERIERAYAPSSDCAPVGFDPTYAGERWEADY
jgi:hypothetical protein